METPEEQTGTEEESESFPSGEEPEADEGADTGSQDEAGESAGDEA